ncbi:MAG: glycoside hydrolase family 25 protein [bacterium]|nr:glycoside hydrolase family 25 protein [bacterium]
MVTKLVVVVIVLSLFLVPVNGEAQAVTERIAEEAKRVVREMRAAVGSEQLGIDVSHYQHEIDWGEVKRNGRVIAFVYIKATEGLDIPDPKFDINWKGAKEYGIMRGAYHFFDAAQDAAGQADVFIKRVGQLEEGDLPPWLDLEAGKYGGVNQVSKKKYTDEVLLWLSRVEKGLGVKPVIYASPRFMRAHLMAPGFAGYLLAVAEYEDGKQPEVAEWTFWQYSQTGKVKGISVDVDLDRFKGTRADLFEIAKKASGGQKRSLATEGIEEKKVKSESKK